jgi:hypothetical protein
MPAATALSSPLLDYAPSGELFPGHPDLESMTEAATSLRVSTLLGLGMLLKHRRLISPTQFDAFVFFSRCHANQRIQIINDPAVRIWLQRSLQIINRLEIDGSRATDADHNHFTDLSEVMATAQDCAAPVLYSIRFARQDVHPLLKAVAPPTYTFPANSAEPSTAYSLEFFIDVARAAFARIEMAWPELRSAVPRFVRLIVHLPDGEFRSASAARYAGTVFFSADDNSLFEVEESIVHEFGHQILYTAMELDPMVEDPTHEGLVLPWSGSERDWYGYFHAFFIYVLLAEYLTRRLQVTVFPEPSIDEERVRLRRDEIMSGIRSALPAINAGALTPAGERVVAALQRRAAGLEANLRRGR